ncbi:hypothetical protein ACFL3I_06290 [Pseudomonadota bacterium]
MFRKQYSHLASEVRKSIEAIYELYTQFGKEEFPRKCSKFRAENSWLGHPLYLFYDETLPDFEIRLEDHRERLREPLSIQAHGMKEYEGFIMFFYAPNEWSCSATDCFGSKATNRAKKLARACAESIGVPDSTDNMQKYLPLW